MVELGADDRGHHRAHGLRPRAARTSTPPRATGSARTSPGSTAADDPGAAARARDGCCRSPRRASRPAASTTPTVKRYLGVVERRVRTGRTGSRWLLLSLAGDGGRRHAGRAAERAGRRDRRAAADRRPVSSGSRRARRGRRLEEHTNELRRQPPPPPARARARNVYWIVSAGNLGYENSFLPFYVLVMDM